MLYNKDASKVIPVGDKSVHVLRQQNLDPLLLLLLEKSGLNLILLMKMKYQGLGMVF